MCWRYSTEVLTHGEGYYVKNCWNYGNITYKGKNGSEWSGYSGGICGESKCLIIGCANDGSVNLDHVGGGIVGMNYSTVEYCRNSR